MSSFATSDLVYKVFNAASYDAFAVLLHSTTPFGLEVCLFNIICSQGLFSGWIIFMFEGGKSGHLSSCYGRKSTVPLAFTIYLHLTLSSYNCWKMVLGT